MVIGIVRIDLYMNDNRSLKAKRQTVKGLIHRVQSRFTNVSISEVDSTGLVEMGQRELELIHY